MAATPQLIVRRLVLVIDDDRVARAFVRAALEQHFTVVGAIDGAAGLAMASLRAPDVVLLDLEMPGLPGREVLRRQRELPTMRRAPVLMLTSHTGAHHAARAFADGAFGYLTKPLSAKDLLARVTEAAARAGVPHLVTASTERKRHHAVACTQKHPSADPYHRTGTLPGRTLAPEAGDRTSESVRG